MRYVAICLTALFASASAVAEDVVVEDYNVFRALETGDKDGYTRDWARGVTATALSDRKLSANDKQIMEALQRGATGETVSYAYYSVAYDASVQTLPADKAPAPKPEDIERITVQPLTGRAAEFVELVAPGMVEGVSMKELWQAKDATKQLYLTAMSSPLVRSNVTRNIASELYGPWKESTLTNGYAPFRESFDAAYNRLKTAGGDDTELVLFGREVLCDAGKLIDDQSSGAVPDHLYQYLMMSEPGLQPCER